MADMVPSEFLIEARKIAHEEVEQAKKDVRALDVEIKKHFDENNTRVSNIEQSLNAARAKVEDIKTDVDKPWFADFRFWAGLSAVPLFILTGRLAKLVDDGATLRLIHKGFGTEAAMTEALSSESEFGRHILTFLETQLVLEKQLDPKAQTLSAAIEASVESKITEKTILEKLLSEQLRKYIGVRQLSILSVGIVDPGRIKFVACKSLEQAKVLQPRGSDNSYCLNAENNAFVETATTLFGAKSGITFDITFGISLAQLEIPKDPKIPLGPIVDITKTYKLAELLDISIDGQAVSPEEQMGRTIPYNIDGKSFSYARYVLRGYKTSVDEYYNGFPMHALTIAMKPKTAQNFLINVAVLISQGAL